MRLIRSLKKITPAIDNNNPKFELNGALLDITSNGINIVATDTRRLAIVHLENSSEKELDIIIPKKAIIEDEVKQCFPRARRRPRTRPRSRY